MFFSILAENRHVLNSLQNREAPSLSSPEDEEIFLLRLAKSWQVSIIIFLPTRIKPHALNIVLSEVWRQRRLIGVKSVEKGDRISPFRGLLTTAETERWILWVRQWLMWPVFQFPGQAQQPSDSRYLLFLWKLGRRCACWLVHHIWRFCWLLPGSPLHLPLWQCRQCVILHKCLGQWHPRPMACLWTMGSMCCRLSGRSFVVGIYDRFTALHKTSFIQLCRWLVAASGELVRQDYYYYYKRMGLFNLRGGAHDRQMLST